MLLDSVAVRRVFRAFLLSAGLGFALGAFADPPAHAPAHGWRKKNDPDYVGYTGRAWEHDYGVIQGRCNRDVIGAAVGAVVGGAIGSRVGEGSDRTVAIIVGSVLGAVIGREIGKELDEGDRACIGHALELAKPGQSVQWINGRTGVTYVLTPASVKDAKDSCRAYSLLLKAGSKSSTQKGRACSNGDGTWKIVA